MGQDGRIQYIDNLKGFTMLLVIIGHITQKMLVFELYPSSSPQMTIINRFIYSFHMPLFMMISGFVFHKAYTTSEGKIAKEKLRVHFFNILIVYVMFSLFEGVVKILFSGDVVEAVSASDLLLILVKPIGGRLWYLYVLLMYYILFSREWIQGKTGTIWLLVVVAILSVVSHWAEYSWLFSVKRALRELLPFYVEQLLSRYGIKMIARKKYVMVLSGIIILTRIALWLNGYDSNEIPVISISFGVVAAMWIFWSFSALKRLNDRLLLSAIGVCSLELYLLHEYPLSLCIKVLPQTIQNAWGLLILTLSITVISVLLVVWASRMMGIRELIFKPFSVYLRRKIVV